MDRDHFAEARQRADRAIRANIALSRRLAAETEIVYTKNVEIETTEIEFHKAQQQLLELTAAIGTLKNALKSRLEANGDVMAHDYFALFNEHLQMQDMLVVDQDFQLKDHAQVWDDDGNNITRYLT